MGKNSTNLNNFLAYTALIIAALLLAITVILPLIGINIGGPFFNVLAFIKDIALLLVVGIGAYYFSKGKKVLSIIFWIAIIVYIACIVIRFF